MREGRDVERREGTDRRIGRQYEEERGLRRSTNKEGCWKKTWNRQIEGSVIRDREKFEKYK